MRYASATAKHQMNERADSYATARIVFASGQAVDLDKDDLWLENSYIESSESSAFPIGTLIAKSVTLSLVNDDERWEGYAFYGCQIFLYSNFDLDDGTTFTIFLGTFSVITPERYGQAIEISGVDDSYKTDKEYTTSLTFPTTANAVFLDACETCVITPAVQAFTNDNYIIAEKPSGTFRQIFGELAALAGGNAKFDNYNRLNIVSYSLDVFTEGNLYGGIFDPATPYATGDTADGGRYNPWNTGDVFNSGTFAELNALFDQYKTHYLPSWLDLTVEADDVVITGVQIERNGIVYRNSVNTNYIITLNPSISTGNEQAYVQLVGGEVIGFRFRPFSGEYISYPLAEAMDLAIIVDRRGRVYNTVLTEVVYNFSGSTSLKCDADAPIRNQARYSSEATKEIVELRNQTVKQINTAEQSAKTYSDGQLNAFKNGDYATFVTNATNAINSKITTYYQSDAPIIHTTGDLWIDTDDDNKLYRWNGVGWVSVRDAGIADALIAAADAQSTADRKIVTFAQDNAPTATDAGDLWIDTNDFNKLYRWSGITWVAVSDSSALNTFIAGTYATDKAAIEGQIDSKAETWYQATNPASSWSAAEKPSHKGDIWYCTATSGTYAGKNWMYSGSDWEEFTAEVPQSVYDMIDGKASIFVGSTTPSNPQAGDLWFKGTNQPILTYVNGSWVTYNKYTDDSTFTTFQNGQYATDQAALRSLVSTENSATKAFANTLSTLIAQGMGLFFTEEVQQDESVIYYMHDKQTLALSTNIWRISGNSWSVSTDGGTTWNAAIDAQGNILVNTLSAVGINFSWASGGILSLGGYANGRGILQVFDENGSFAGNWDANGLWSRTSISTAEGFSDNLPHTKITQANVSFYTPDNNSPAKVYMAYTWEVGSPYHPSLVLEGEEGIYLKGKDGTDYVPFIIVNPTNTVNGFDEDILLKNSIFFGQPDDPNSNTTALVQLGKFTQIQWGLRPQESVYRNLAWLKFSATGNTDHDIEIHCNHVNLGSQDWGTALYVYGSKHRAVVTKNYGIVGMSAFESANALFSDVGSGTVGEDGTVTIVFDPIFAETIEMNMEYQVLITRTSAKETEWVDKQHGMFIVHGEAGATFDWMVIARQIEYGLHRTPQIEPVDDNNDGIPIVPEDNSALAAVEEMVQQFEEGADIL